MEEDVKNKLNDLASKIKDPEIAKSIKEKQKYINKPLVKK